MASIDSSTTPQTVTAPQHTLPEHVYIAITRYLQQVDGYDRTNLYNMVMEEIEPALFEAVIHYTKGNQSQAANILGLNRATLRKKIKRYGLLQK